MNSNNMQFQHNLNATIQDLKTHVGQLANISTRLENLPSQTIPNPKGNASVVSLRSAGELPQQTALQQKPRPVDAESEPEADSLVSQQTRSIPLPFPTRTLSARKAETDEDLLKMFRKVEINIPLLDVIKKIHKSCVYIRGKKMKGKVELGGIVSALTRNKVVAGSKLILPKKCRDPRIFFVPCTIGECTFVDAMLDLGASINCCATHGVLEDVLVQVNELIFLTDFYVLDMEDKTPGKGSTLILGRPFFLLLEKRLMCMPRCSQWNLVTIWCSSTYLKL
ncbi:hypothetical protein CR513_02283, partial [Mucuna pruriens]